MVCPGRGLVGMVLGVASSGPFHLPGEDPSPYDAPLDPVRAAELRAQLVALGVSESEVGKPWEQERPLLDARKARESPLRQHVGGGCAKPTLFWMEGKPQINRSRTS